MTRIVGLGRDLHIVTRTSHGDIVFALRRGTAAELGDATHLSGPSSRGATAALELAELAWLASVDANGLILTRLAGTPAVATRETPRGEAADALAARTRAVALAKSDGRGVLFVVTDDEIALLRLPGFEVTSLGRRSGPRPQIEAVETHRGVLAVLTFGGLRELHVFSIEQGAVRAVRHPLAGAPTSLSVATNGSRVAVAWIRDQDGAVEGMLLDAGGRALEAPVTLWEESGSRFSGVALAFVDSTFWLIAHRARERTLVSRRWGERTELLHASDFDAMPTLLHRHGRLELVAATTAHGDQIALRWFSEELSEHPARASSILTPPLPASLRRSLGRDLARRALATRHGDGIGYRDATADIEELEDGASCVEGERRWTLRFVADAFELVLEPREVPADTASWPTRALARMADWLHGRKRDAAWRARAETWFSDVLEPGHPLSLAVATPQTRTMRARMTAPPRSEALAALDRAFLAACDEEVTSEG